ncbi:hypothetical protein J8V17_17440 [Photorhabdus bodei]|nr:hypothetical protein [Photorhabdus bodei]MCC8466661.1 hypothetical protein [Photorhabdus bodei]
MLNASSKGVTVKAWAAAENPLLGITPIMNWVREFYNKEYAPNTRETFRRQVMHQFCHASIVLYNPDKPDCIRGIHYVIENILPALCWGEGIPEERW